MKVPITGLKLKVIGRWMCVLLLTLMISTCTQPASPAEIEPQNRQAIEINGIIIEGEFLDFFYIYGGEQSLGQPLTPEIIVDGWRVQYFEKGRLEYHPENEPAYRVTVGWLGDLLNRRRPRISAGAIPAHSGPTHRYYAETGHTLSGDFLAYFDKHGGTVRFGMPISEPFILEGKLVQDFQSARFFWTPTLSPPVTLENIGKVHLDRLDLNE